MQSAIELSPEQIEKAMRLVQDINASETAYTCIGIPGRSNMGRAEKEIPSSVRMEGIRSLLNDGLLGLPYHSSNKKASSIGEVRRNLWYQAVCKVRRIKSVEDSDKLEPSEYDKVRDNLKMQRSEGDVEWAYLYPKVHFNIIGRSVDMNGNNNPKTEPIKNMKDQRDYLSEGGIVLIFDLTKFEEICKTPQEWWSRYYRDPLNSKNRQYWGVYPLFSMPGKFDLEYGFVLNNRIAPRYFKGLVVFPNMPLPEYELARQEQYNWSFRIHMEREVDISKIEPQMKRFTEEMSNLYRDMPDKVLPVYDLEGNLWWPKQMSYQDVKSFVSKRD